MVKSGMDLRAYLEREETTYSAFARQIGVSPQAVQRYVVGERRPSAEIMTAIAHATDGDVRPNDFFDPPSNDSTPDTKVAI